MGPRPPGLGGIWDCSDFCVKPGSDIDIWAVDGDVTVAIEVKSRLSQGDVDGFLDTLSRFRLAFPHYGDYLSTGPLPPLKSITAPGLGQLPIPLV